MRAGMNRVHGSHLAGALASRRQTSEGRWPDSRRIPHERVADGGRLHEQGVGRRISGKPAAFQSVRGQCRGSARFPGSKSPAVEVDPGSGLADRSDFESGAKKGPNNAGFLLPPDCGAWSYVAPRPAETPRFPGFGSLFGVSGNLIAQNCANSFLNALGDLFGALERALNPNQFFR